MRILALDTAGPGLSAAWVEDGNVKAHAAEQLGRGHAERLLPVLDLVRREAGRRWSEIDLVAVTTGPGNFTGLRAGIAVARTLSLALGCPICGVGTLEAVAQSAASIQAGAGCILVAMDARRTEVYLQRFELAMTAIGSPAAATLEEAAALVTPETALVGDAAALLRERTGNGVLWTWELDARHVAAAAQRRLADGERGQPGHAIRPLYVRPPDARIGAGASLLPA